MKIKITKIIAGLLIALYSTSSSAQQVASKNDSITGFEKRDFQFSFVPGVGTSEGTNENYINRISLNILVGRENGFEGIEFGGIYNINKYNGNGAQFATIGNHIGGNMTGIQYSGVTNTVGGDFTGAQLSYVMNYTKGNVTGFQSSDFINIVRGNIKGGQIGGFYNFAKGNVIGAQLAGFGNKSDSVKGAQVAGFINVNNTIKGAQVAGFTNIAKEVNGAQVSGFINVAKNISGSQFAVINIADSLDKGVAFGVINIIKNGLIQGGIESNEIMDINATFRSGTTRLYSILQFGFQANDSELWSYGAGFGTQMTIKNKFKGNLELTTQSVHHSDTMDELNLINRLSYNLGFQMAKHLTISAGPALNIYVNNMKNTDATNGFDFGQNTFYDTTEGNTNIQMWVGYNLAIKF